MSRVIRIEKCAECPHWREPWGCSAMSYVLDASRQAMNPETIPTWCPLERAPEPKGASDEN